MSSLNAIEAVRFRDEEEEEEEEEEDEGGGTEERTGAIFGLLLSIDNDLALARL